MASAALSPQISEGPSRTPADMLAAARERAAVRGKGASGYIGRDAPMSPNQLANTSMPWSKPPAAAESFAKQLARTTTFGNSSTNDNGGGLMDSSNGALQPTEGDPLADGDAMLDMDAFQDPDPLGFNKPAYIHPSMLQRVAPQWQFPPNSALMPDGRGDSLHQAVVTEIVSGDSGEHCTPAFHELLLAGEAVALHKNRASDRLVNEYVKDLGDPALGALLSHDGLARGRALPVSEGNLKRVARRELSEYVHGFSETSRRRRAESAGQPYSPITPVGDGPLHGPVWMAAGIRPHILAKAASGILSRPLGDPCDGLPGRFAAIDSSGSTFSIGSSSFDSGAVSAREYAMSAALRASAAEQAAMEKGQGGQQPSKAALAAAAPLPALRIVRPLAGNAVELALADVEPALLAIDVAGVTFRDHPLFSREDYLASGLRGLYTEYVRRMRANAVAAVDAKLRSLLSYALIGGADEGGEAQVRAVYDFESDALPDLCARAGAVLECLSSRYEEVTSCAILMGKLWGRWDEVVKVRQDTGLVLTGVRMEAKEVTPTGAAGTSVPIPALHPILYAAAMMLERLNGMAQDEGEDEGTGARAAVRARAATVALRIVASGSMMLSRIADGEASRGKGYGCGGLGSGVDSPSLPSKVGRGYPYPGAREFVFRLHNDQTFTPDDAGAVHKLEKQRRALVRSTFVVSEVLVNGRIVARSAPVQLHLPDFTAPAAVRASIRLYRRPASISVRVCDASSILFFILGPTVLSEVLVPVPGHSSLKRGVGIEVGGEGEEGQGVATVSTSAMEPVSGVYEFSGTQPMSGPYFDPAHPLRAEQAVAAATLAAGGAAGLPLPLPLIAGTSSSSSSGFTHQRLTCGLVGVSAAWQVPSSSSGTGVAGGGVGGSAPSTSLVPVPALDSGALASGITSAAGLGTSLLSMLNKVRGGTQSSSLTSAQADNLVGGGSQFGDPEHERRHGPHGGSRGGASASFSARLGDSRLLSELAALPVPRALAGGVGGPGDTLRMSLTGGAGGVGGMSQSLTLVGAHALRRSQMLASAEAALEETRAGLASQSIPMTGVDPNDPRAAASMVLRGGGGSMRGPGGATSRATRFRVDTLPRALAFNTQAVGPAAGLGFGFGYGALDIAGGAIGALVPLPGRQRQQLLRLRAERGDLFRELHEPIPLQDEEVGSSIALRELLRSALVSLGYSEQTADALQYGPLAYLRQGAKALGMSVDQHEEALTGGGGRGRSSAAEVAKARLLIKVRDFLSRVRASPLGRLRYRRRMLFAMLVKEVSMASSRATLLDFNRMAALLGPKRSLRPRAIDFGVASGGADSAGMPLPLLGSAATGGTQYRLTIQIVRARNVPVRRALPSLRSSMGVGSGPGSLSSPGMSMSPGVLLSPKPGQGMATGGFGPGAISQASTEPVMAVIEARFQGRATRSSASRGTNPQWNEVLALPFIPPGNDVSPARLADVEDVLTLSLFDEVATESRVDDRDRMTTVVRRTRRFLGTAVIPFVSLYSAGGSLAAELRLDTPHVNLGYRAPTVTNSGPSTLTGGGGEMGGGEGAAFLGAVSDPVGTLAVAEANRRSTHVYVHVAIDPPLPSPEEEDKEDADGDALGPSSGGSGGGGDSQLASLRTMRSASLLPEERHLLEFAARWGDKHSARLEGGGLGSGAAVSVVRNGLSLALSLDSGPGVFRRTAKAIVSNIVGEPILMLRYLCPQAPPPDPAAAVVAYMQAQLVAAETGGSGGMRTPARKRPAGIGSVGEGDGEGKDGEGVSEGAAAVSGTGGEFMDPTSQLPTVSALVPRMSTPDAVIRFVSLIPYMADTHAFGSHSAGADLWATSQECLDMGAGDGEEHAIMLHNYLTWLEAQGQGGTGTGWRSFIVIGRGHPEGDTVYVLRQNKDTPHPTNLIINAVTGRSYLAGDDTCPLLSVGCVASSTNAWANIQPACEPSRISWDLGDAKAWEPLFGPKRPHPGPQALPSVQTPLVYRVPDTRLASALESEISGSLSAAIRAWRPRYVTRIRGDVSTALRPLLLELEARATGVSGSTVLPSSDGLVQVSPGGIVSPVTITSSGAVILPTMNRGGDRGGMAASALAQAGANVRDLAAEHTMSLDRLASRYRPFGFPLHLSFTDIDAVLGAIKATGIHRIEDEAVQYALAVAVVPYPNDIFSVWVYAVALMPMQA